jgi:hypothetical protein
MQHCVCSVHGPPAPPNRPLAVRPRRQLHATPTFLRKRQLATLLGAQHSQMWRASSKRALVNAQSGSSAVANGTRTALKRAKVRRPAPAMAVVDLLSVAGFPKSHPALTAVTETEKLVPRRAPVLAALAALVSACTAAS